MIKTGRGADRAMDITNMLFAVTFMATRIVIYATGLAQLLWDLVSIWATADGETWLVALPQCKMRLTEEDEDELEQIQIDDTKDADAALIGCGGTQQMMCGVVVLLVAGQVLNLIWARQIVRMARKSQRNATEANERGTEDARVVKPTESSNVAGQKEKSA